MTALPFRANKRFVLDGRQVCPGDVVDVSMLDPARVRNMERGNYGMRVASDIDHVQTKSDRKPVRQRTVAERPAVPAAAIVEPDSLVELEKEVSL